MADIDFKEREIYEQFILGTNGQGYVLDFTDNSFQLFVGDITGIDIHKW